MVKISDKKPTLSLMKIIPVPERMKPPGVHKPSLGSRTRQRGSFPPFSKSGGHDNNFPRRKSGGRLAFPGSPCYNGRINMMGLDKAPVTDRARWKRSSPVKGNAFILRVRLGLEGRGFQPLRADRLSGQN